MMCLWSFKKNRVLSDRLFVAFGKACYKKTNEKRNIGCLFLYYYIVKEAGFKWVDYVTVRSVFLVQYSFLVSPR